MAIGAATGAETEPLVSVVVVNLNGERFLAGLLDCLRRQTWRRLEVICVDNASIDRSRELVRDRYPEVRLLALPRNVGFAAGNNAGIGAARGELVALLNNDTLPDPDWLRPLVAAAGRSAEVAAVTSKIVFLKPFLPLRLVSEPAGAVLYFDDRSAFEGCDYRKPICKEGFGGRQPLGGGGRWRAEGHATVFLPVEDAAGAARLELRLAGGPGARAATVAIGDHPLGRVELGSELRASGFEIPASVVAAESFDVLNNAGSYLDERGNAGDRGIYEPDRGQYDRGEEIGAFCGAAVLLRRSALARHGAFDEDFFAYYEDIDLSWRLRSAGYRLLYEPASLVRHAHAASSGAWSPAFVFFAARNRILTVAKNGAPAQLLRAYGRELRRLLALLASRLPGGRGRGELPGELGARLRVQSSLAWQLPRALLKRTRRHPSRRTGTSAPPSGGRTRP